MVKSNEDSGAATTPDKPAAASAPNAKAAPPALPPTPRVPAPAQPSAVAPRGVTLEQAQRMVADALAKGRPTMERATAIRLATEGLAQEWPK